MKRSLLLAMAAVALAGAAAVRAHTTHTSYLSLHGDESGAPLAVRWELSLLDLRWTIDFDANHDGGIVWEEVEAQRDSIGALAASHLRIERAGEACALTPGDVSLARRSGEPYIALAMSAQCPRDGGLAVRADLFLSGKPTEQILIDVRSTYGQYTSALTADAPRWTEPPAPSRLATFVRFIGQGAWHVWIGYDHVAFLLLLVLPSVLQSTGEGWRSASSLRQVARDLVTIVTAFTVAHSVTLGLAVTGTVELPALPVEIAIAASIIAAGLLNLLPRAAGWRLPLAFGFGLVHGFGFANALAELGPTGTRLVPILAGFNVGVELAQLTLVAAVLPLLLRLSASPFYAARLMPALSLATAITGAAWLAERLP